MLLNWKSMFGWLARIHRRTKAVLGMAAIDPARCKPVAVGWYVIVEQAFGGMQNAAA